jgi:hypothetical protein
MISSSHIVRKAFRVEEVPVKLDVVTRDIVSGEQTKREAKESVLRQQRTTPHQHDFFGTRCANQHAVACAEYMMAAQPLPLKKRVHETATKRD